MRGRERVGRGRQRGGTPEPRSRSSFEAVEQAEEASLTRQHRRRPHQRPPVGRGAGVLEAPEFEFTPDPNLSPDEREQAIADLRAKGHRVRVTSPKAEPKPMDPRVLALESAKHPLYGRTDIASARVEGNTVRLMVHGSLGANDQERAKKVKDLEKVAIALARHHGSNASEVEITVIPPLEGAR